MPIVQGPIHQEAKMANERNKGGREEQGHKRETQRPREGQGSMTVEEAGHRGGQRERELVKEGHREEDKTRR